MVLKPEPIFEALEAVKTDINNADGATGLPVVLLTPQGRLFSRRLPEG